MIKNVAVYGLVESMVASGYPMVTDIEQDAKERASSDDQVYSMHFGDEPMKASDYKRCEKLGNARAGSGHDSYLKGVIVQFDWTTPVLMQPQIQRYHHIDIISSQSAMHRITNRDEFTHEDFGTAKVRHSVIGTLNILLDEYKYALVNLGKEEIKETWRSLIDNLPQSYLKTARYTTNYLQLKTMYNQRKGHKLVEWKEFCDWCETLPHFKDFCLGG